MMPITSLVLGMLVASQGADLSESWRDYPACNRLESAQNSHTLLTERGNDRELAVFSAGHTDDIRNAVLIDWLGEVFPGPAS